MQAVDMKNDVPEMRRAAILRNLMQCDVANVVHTCTDTVSGLANRLGQHLGHPRLARLLAHIVGMLRKQYNLHYS